MEIRGPKNRFTCFPTKSPGNPSPSVLAFLLYVEISQWLDSRGAKLKKSVVGSLKKKAGLTGQDTLPYRTGSIWVLILSPGAQGNKRPFRSQVLKPNTAVLL